MIKTNTICPCCKCKLREDNTAYLLAIGLCTSCFRLLKKSYLHLKSEELIKYADFLYYLAKKRRLNSIK